MSYRMREAVDADAGFIAELFALPHARQYLNDPGSDGISGRLEEPDVEAYIVESERSAAGYFDLRNRGWLVEFGALIAQQPGNGLGRFALEWGVKRALESGARRITLQIREDNDVARGLCARLGFQQEGFLRDAFRDAGSGLYKNMCVYGLISE